MNPLVSRSSARGDRRVLSLVVALMLPLLSVVATGHVALARTGGGHGCHVCSASRMKPTIDFGIPEPDQTLQGVCAFSVRAHWEGAGDVRYITWFDASGAVKLREISVWPGYKVTYTNLATGTSRTYADSGPGFFRQNPDGASSGSGNWTWFPTEPAGTKRGIFMSSGHFEQAADGTVLSFHGTTKDVCADLAG